jgi:transposase
MSYDKQVRERAVAYRKEGHTIEETAAIFKIGTATLKTWVKQYEQTGNLEKKPLNRSFRKIDPEALTAYVSEHPDAYQSEMASESGCSESGIRKVLKKLKITHKKNGSLP